MDASASELNSPPQDARPSTVLVVDDNEANRDALGRRLQRHGYDIAMAADGPSALALIGQRPFDLILLDVMMPGMSGLEVLERLRKDHPATRLPIIMATARDQSEDIIAALRLGANDYVTKPLDFPVVLARVQTQLALKKSVEQVIALEERLCERNKALETANLQFREAAERTGRDLRAATRVQESFLPPARLQVPGMRFAWAFKPCETLAGDSLNICPLDASHVGVYVLDVTGHGVAAALSAVAATRFLSPASDPESLLVRRNETTGILEPVPPAEVAGRLNRKFAWDSTTGQFVTLFYAVVNTQTGECRYVSAGHPGAIHLRSGQPPATLQGSGLPIGIGETYDQQSTQLAPGDRLYLYSDGLTDARDPNRQSFETDRLLQALQRGQTISLEDSIAMVLAQIESWCAGVPPHDDISVVALEFTGNS
ncbi:MAG TPA: SpoIIE family protein phosphatase [Tepidisphaeraceae bacterium]|nr:SpoIIE family protein phosphatase [Tepidisphaeraceae bacterium]